MWEACDWWFGGYFSELGEFLPFRCCLGKQSVCLYSKTKNTTTTLFTHSARSDNINFTIFENKIHIFVPLCNILHLFLTETRQDMA